MISDEKKAYYRVYETGQKTVAGTYSSCIGRTNLLLREGDALDMHNGKLYPIALAPMADTTKGLQQGNYVAGKDIPAGEYILMPYEDEPGSVTISGVYWKDIGPVKYYGYATVETGEKLRVNSGIVYSAEAAPKPDISYQHAVESYLKAGVDLPSGTYELTPQNSECTLKINDSSSTTYQSILSETITEKTRFEI